MNGQKSTSTSFRLGHKNSTERGLSASTNHRNPNNLKKQRFEIDGISPIRDVIKNGEFTIGETLAERHQTSRLLPQNYSDREYECLAEQAGLKRKAVEKMCRRHNRALVADKVRRSFKEPITPREALNLILLTVIIFEISMLLDNLF